jgi:hypothetical protein
MLIVAPSVASAHVLGILAKDPDTVLMVNSVGSDNYKAIPRVTNEQIPQRTHSMDENEENYPTSTVLPDIEAEAIIMHFPGITSPHRLIPKSHHMLMFVLRHISTTLRDKEVVIDSQGHEIAGVCMMLSAFIKPGGCACWPAEYHSSTTEIVKPMLIGSKSQVVSTNTVFLSPANETAESINTLERCLLVLTLGGVLPAYFAKRLTQNGIWLATRYGLTELPIVLDPMASAGDPAVLGLSTNQRDYRTAPVIPTAH